MPISELLGLQCSASESDVHLDCQWHWHATSTASGTVTAMTPYTVTVCGTRLLGGALLATLAHDVYRTIPTTTKGSYNLANYAACGPSLPLAATPA